MKDVEELLGKRLGENKQGGERVPVVGENGEEFCHCELEEDCGKIEEERLDGIGGEFEVWVEEGMERHGQEKCSS